VAAFEQAVMVPVDENSWRKTGQILGLSVYLHVSKALFQIG